MSTIDTSTWSPDSSLNTDIGGIPLNADASIQQTWQAIQMLMAALKGDTNDIKLTINQPDGTTIVATNQTISVVNNGHTHTIANVTGLQTALDGKATDAVMQGATASADGTSGLVPKPLAGDQSKVLKGDGTWGTVATANHVHGNITNDGKVGTISGIPLVTGSGGAVQAGSFGSSAGTFCEGNDSRLSDARTPTSHTHGSITNDGKLGTASRAVVTDANGAVDVSGVTATELGYLSGVTSALQTQINAKATDSDTVHKTGNETVAGEKTFSSDITAGAIKRGVKNGSLYFMGGSDYYADSGAKLYLYGGQQSTNPGEILLQAGNSSGYKQLYAKPDGTLTWDGNAIQTASDERLKTKMDAVPDEVLDAWSDVRWGQFQFLDAVERKGESARLHLGLIAQQVKATFEAHRLDACAYGILCHELREATENEPATDLWTIRYEEALAMEAMYQRRRADRLEARIRVLEEAIHGGR